MKNKQMKKELCSHCGASEIERALKYDPNSGEFSWSTSNFRNGRIAGTIDGHGYRKIVFQKIPYKAHRLAWFFVHGEWPEMIDHIDGDKSNNAIKNLRPSTNSLNQRNRYCHRNGQAVGVHKRKDNGMWIAQFWIKEKKIYVGQYKTMQAANIAYQQKYREMMEAWS